MAVFVVMARFDKIPKVIFGKIWRGKYLAKKNLEVWSTQMSWAHLVSQTAKKGQK